MKKIKLFAVLCCAVVCAFTFSSCEKQKSFTYTTFIANESGSSSFVADHEAVVNYLASKGCAEGTTFVITDATVEKCDEQAKAKFEAMVKNLSREELAEKVGAFHFDYNCSRPVDASNPNNTVTIATWKY
jgi:hypothetical protein